MNTIKNFFKKMWKGIRNFFSVDPVKTVDMEKTETVPCNCNPDCHCDKDNCKCTADNKNIEQQNKDYEQITFFDDLPEDPSPEDVSVIDEEVIVRYTDETVTRDILIAVLRENGVTGISRLKKAELLVKFHELGLEFPEVN